MPLGILIKDLFSKLKKNDFYLLKNRYEESLIHYLKWKNEVPINPLFWPCSFSPQNSKNYLKHIIDLPENEWIRKVYDAQKSNPVRGDWTELVKTDFEKINMQYDESQISRTDKTLFKRHIKMLMRDAAFKYLKNKQSTHMKVKHILYEKFELQEYLRSHKFTNKEAATLVALRSNTVRHLKDNFHSYYSNDILCPLCKNENDTQLHCLTCPKILESMEATTHHLSYDNI